MYKLILSEGKARRGTFETVHGTVQTPAFMNVATSAAIKGGCNVKVGVFSMAVTCSHGRERTHMLSLTNTTNLMLAYVLDICWTESVLIPEMAEQLKIIGFLDKGHEVFTLFLDF